LWMVKRPCLSAKLPMRPGWLAVSPSAPRRPEARCWRLHHQIRQHRQRLQRSCLARSGRRLAPRGGEYQKLQQWRLLLCRSPQWTRHLPRQQQRLLQQPPRQDPHQSLQQLPQQLLQWWRPLLPLQQLPQRLLQWLPCRRQLQQSQHRRQLWRPPQQLRRPLRSGAYRMPRQRRHQLRRPLEQHPWRHQLQQSQVWHQRR